MLYPNQGESYRVAFSVIIIIISLIHAMSVRFIIKLNFDNLWSLLSKLLLLNNKIEVFLSKCG